MIITSENELKKALEFFPIWLADCDNHTFITKISTKTYPKATPGIYFLGIYLLITIVD